MSNKEPNNSEESNNGSKSYPDFCFTGYLPDLIGKKACEIAESFGKNDKREKDKDKTTQLRKFYDEIIKLNQLSAKRDSKTLEIPEEIKISLHMLKAKVAYAKGRELVSINFEKFIVDGVNSCKCKKSLNNFKLVFESVLGFYKQYDKS